MKERELRIEIIFLTLRHKLDVNNLIQVPIFLILKKLKSFFHGRYCNKIWRTDISQLIFFIWILILTIFLVKIEYSHIASHYSWSVSKIKSNFKGISKATGVVLWKKVFLKIPKNSQ